MLIQFRYLIPDEKMLTTNFPSFEAQLPAWASLPSFFASRGYKAPTSATDTAFQLAHSTPLTAFQYAAGNPKLMADFAKWMQAQRQGEDTWLSVMQHEDLLDTNLEETGKGKNRALLVDVGGGIGHQSKQLRAWLPEEKKVRIVLQDLPRVLSMAGEIPGVEVMNHDFWNEQPVKGKLNLNMRKKIMKSSK